MSTRTTSLTVWIIITACLICFDVNVGLCVTPLPIQLSVKQTCEDWVEVTYQPNPPMTQHSTPADTTYSMCDLTYWSLTDKLTSIRILSNYPMAGRDIRISNLTRKTAYVIYMLCDQQFRSNNVTFLSGSECGGFGKQKFRGEKKDKEEVYSTPVVLEEKGLAQMSKIDITLGVVFGVFGAVILAAAAYYFWKNHQRRQRVLRVFGQTHTDPFEALHNSMEESSIISL